MLTVFGIAFVCEKMDKIKLNVEVFLLPENKHPFSFNQNDENVDDAVEMAKMICPGRSLRIKIGNEFVDVPWQDNPVLIHWPKIKK